MGNAQQIETLELDIEDAKRTLDSYESFERLQTNPDFRKIIDQGYFIEEPARIAFMLSNPAMQGGERQAPLYNGIIGVGMLRQYFIGLRTAAVRAEKTLYDAQNAQTEILEEED